MRPIKMFCMAVVMLSAGCAGAGGARGKIQSGASACPDRDGENAMQAQAEMTPPSAGKVAVADNPTVTDPDKYQAVMENEHVRVLRYHDEPGAKTNQHSHPDSLLYALSSFRRRLIFPDGTVKERDFKAGDVMWVPAQTHVGENIGTTATEVLLIEMK